ncbi:MAG: hypothetical protein PVSMB1_13410 [Gemmatimonadaceae bacterium]
MLTLVSGGALALVSAELGLFAGDVRKRIDDRRRRAAIATALLIELRWLEQNLRALHGHPQAALSTRQLITPVFDQFATDSVLFFRPGTVRGILHFRALVRDIQVPKDVVRPESSSIERAHHYFRMKAGFAALLIPDLKNRLEVDGGASCRGSLERQRREWASAGAISGAARTARAPISLLLLAS